MRNVITKLLPLMLVLMLVLTGCNLIEVDQVAVVGKERAALEKEMRSTIMADYNGGQVTREDVSAIFYSNLSYLQYMYSMYGLSIDNETVNETLKDAVEQKIEYIALDNQFSERGLTLEKSDEDYAAAAQESYDNNLNTALESVEGATKEEKDARAAYALYSQGFTVESLEALERSADMGEAVRNNVRDEITEVTDEELQTAFDAQVAADEETYTANPTSIENKATSADAIIAWYPEGYRTVKHILVKPEDDVLSAVTDARNALKAANTAIDDLNDEMAALTAEPAEGEEETEIAEPARTSEEIQADIDAKTTELPALETAVTAAETACIASVQTKLDEIYAALANGEAFDAVMATYGEDPGMQSEPAMTTGYYVCADSTTWDSNFTAGAMALNAAGEYSATPVISTSGVHIIYYNADVTPGAVELDTIREALYADTLEDLKDAHYDDSLASWIDAMNVTYHLDAWTLQ